MKPISLEEAALLFDLGVVVYWQDWTMASINRKDWISVRERPYHYITDEYLHWAIYDYETDHS